MTQDRHHQKNGVIVNALSIDLEDWYQGLTSTSQRFHEWNQFEERISKTVPFLLGILREMDVRATFFVLGHVAETHPKLVEALCAEGHEVASHGHRHRFVHSTSPEEFRQDVQRSIRALQSITGSRVKGYRAPAFSIDQRTPWALSILEELGIEYDSSIFPARSLLHGWPGAPRFPYHIPSTRNLLEMPVSTLKFMTQTFPVGGGFYNRIMPGTFSRWAIRRINAQGHPAILYFHPWEFDLDQSRPESITLRERITHYVNRRTSAPKLRILLQEFKFSPMNVVAKQAITKRADQR